MELQRYGEISGSDSVHENTHRDFDRAFRGSRFALFMENETLKKEESKFGYDSEEADTNSYIG